MYYAAVEAGDLAVSRGIVLNSDDVLRRDITGRLICHGQLDLSEIGAEYDIHFDTYISRELRRFMPYVEDGQVTMSTERISLTPRGRLLVRSVASCFDAYSQTD